MIRAAGLVFTLFLVGDAVAQAPSPGLAPWNSSAIASAPLYLGAERFGALTYAGGLFLTSAETGRLGGLSGLEAVPIDKDSVQFYAVSDMGDFVRFTGKLNGVGRLTGVGDLTLFPLRGEDQKPLQGKSATDAEDLSIPPDTPGFLVSFERRHRITAYEDPSSATAAVFGLNRPTQVARLPKNSGMEALAALPGGVIAVGAEDGRIWLCPPSNEPCKQIHAKGGPDLLYGLTGLDHLPGSDEMVGVWRRPSPLGGFSTIIGHIKVVDGKAGIDALAALPTFSGNVEGVSIVPGQKDGWRLYLITDNGFDVKSPSRIMAFDWTP